VRYAQALLRGAEDRPRVEIRVGLQQTPQPFYLALQLVYAREDRF
jgi:hypothetical protein